MIESANVVRSPSCENTSEKGEIVHILDNLNQAATSDEETKEQLIHELAQTPFETLPVMIEVLTIHPKRLWSTAAEVIYAIGYPANTAALGTLLDHVGDGKSPARENAIPTLLEMEMGVVGAAIIDIFLERGRHTPFWRDTLEKAVETLLERGQPLPSWAKGVGSSIERRQSMQYWKEAIQGISTDQSTQYWRDAVQGIGSFLAQQAPVQLLDVCGPTVAYLLSQPALFGDEREIQTGILFGILERLGPSCGVYAMPVLLDLLKDEYMQDEREAIWSLIQACREEVKAPYHTILHRLSEEMQ